MGSALLDFLHGGSRGRDYPARLESHGPIGHQSFARLRRAGIALPVVFLTGQQTWLNESFALTKSFIFDADVSEIDQRPN